MLETKASLKRVNSIARRMEQELSFSVRNENIDAYNIGNRGRPEKKYVVTSPSFIIISEFPNMINVLHALGELPKSAYEKSPVQGALTEFMWVSPDLAYGEAKQYIDEMVAAGSEIIFDERSGIGNLVTRPGTVRFRNGRYYKIFTADIDYSGGVIEHEEVAYSFLRHLLVVESKETYAKLVSCLPKDKNKKAKKMNSISRTVDFAGLLSCGRIDYSLFRKRAAHETENAKHLIGVRFSRDNFPENLRYAFDAVMGFIDVSKLWRAAISKDKELFNFSYLDIDDGTAKDKIRACAEAVGVETFLDAWEAGVPVNDLTRGFLA